MTGTWGKSEVLIRFARKENRPEEAHERTSGMKALHSRERERPEAKKETLHGESGNANQRREPGWDQMKQGRQSASKK